MLRFGKREHRGVSLSRAMPTGSLCAMTPNSTRPADCLNSAQSDLATAPNALKRFSPYGPELKENARSGEPFVLGGLRRQPDNNVGPIARVQRFHILQQRASLCGLSRGLLVRRTRTLSVQNASAFQPFRTSAWYPLRDAAVCGREAYRALSPRRGRGREPERCSRPFERSLSWPQQSPALMSLKPSLRTMRS
jgi:hypothetical protein